MACPRIAPVLLMTPNLNGNNSGGSCDFCCVPHTHVIPYAGRNMPPSDFAPTTSQRRFHLPPSSGQ